MSGNTAFVPFTIMPTETQAQVLRFLNPTDELFYYRPEADGTLDTILIDDDKFVVAYTVEPDSFDVETDTLVAIDGGWNDTLTCMTPYDLVDITIDQHIKPFMASPSVAQAKILAHLESQYDIAIQRPTSDGTIKVAVLDDDTYVAIYSITGAGEVTSKVLIDLGLGFESYSVTPQLVA